MHHTIDVRTCGYGSANRHPPTAKSKLQPPTADLEHQLQTLNGEPEPRDANPIPKTTETELKAQNDDTERSTRNRKRAPLKGTQDADAGPPNVTWHPSSAAIRRRSPSAVSRSRRRRTYALHTRRDQHVILVGRRQDCKIPHLISPPRHETR